MKTPEAFTQALKEKLGSSLRSVVQYGSAASSHGEAGFSGNNLLIVLENSVAASLDSIRPALIRWVGAGNSAPKIFTWEEMRGARDVFPIEFIDIQRAHRVIHGDDPFSGLEIHESNLRHQLEYELRAALLKLRAAYIRHGEKPRELLRTAMESLSSITVLFRAVLRTGGETAPEKWPDIWRALHARVPMDVESLETVLALRQNPKMKVERPKELFARVMSTVEAVVRFIDSKDEGRRTN